MRRAGQNKDKALMQLLESTGKWNINLCIVSILMVTSSMTFSSVIGKMQA